MALGTLRAFTGPDSSAPSADQDSPLASDRGPEGAHMNANSLGNAVAGMDIPKLEGP